MYIWRCSHPGDSKNNPTPQNPMSDITVAILSSTLFFEPAKLDLIRNRTRLPEGRVILYDTPFRYEDFMEELSASERLKEEALFVLLDIAFADPDLNLVSGFARSVKEVNPRAFVFTHSTADMDRQCDFFDGHILRSQFQRIPLFVWEASLRMEESLNSTRSFLQILSKVGPPPWAE